MNNGWSGDGGLRPRPMPPGGKIELAPLPPLPFPLPPVVVTGGSILVPNDVAPKTPPAGGESPPPGLTPVRPVRGLVAVAPRTGPIPRPMPVVPRPLLEL